MLWEQWRHEGLTSSDACAAAGQSTRRTPRQVANRKRRELVLENRPPTEAMFWGDAMEPQVAREGARRLGMHLANDRALSWQSAIGPRSQAMMLSDFEHRTRWVVQSRDEPIVRATPDYIAISETGESVIVECKTTDQYKRWTDGVPLNVQWQVQWHMLAADVRRAIVPVLFFRPTRILRVWKLDRLPDFEPGGKVSQWVRAWWDRHVVAGEPLLPYRERVRQALRKILASRPWTAPQRKWLDRIGKQLEVETIVDREALDHGQFRSEGGFLRLDKVFDGKLEEILHEIVDAVWQAA